MRVAVVRRQLEDRGADGAALAQFDLLADSAGRWEVDWTAETQERLLREGRLHRWIGAAVSGGILPLWRRHDRDLPAADLPKAGLAGWWLVRADLRGANLAGADLTGAVLFDADLSEANLQGADLSRSFLNLADFSGADLSRTRFAGAEAFRVDFTGANLRGAQCHRAHFAYASVAGADFTGANLEGADLHGVDFSQAALTDAYLSGARRRHVDDPLPGWSPAPGQGEIDLQLQRSPIGGGVKARSTGEVGDAGDLFLATEPLVLKTLGRTL